MSDFWDSFTSGADSTIGTMGEDVSIAGRAPIQGVVQPVEVSPGIVAGGQSKDVTHTIQVSMNDGDAVADGDKVESRMLQGRVIRKEHFGGGWILYAGPVNRWKEEDFG